MPRPLCLGSAWISYDFSSGNVTTPNTQELHQAQRYRHSPSRKREGVRGWASATPELVVNGKLNSWRRSPRPNPYSLRERNVSDQ